MIFVRRFLLNFPNKPKTRRLSRYFKQGVTFAERPDFDFYRHISY
ncbi:MAG: hypothetical protein JWR12_2417 [Mucilaginibacter sp.]|nr:hypothetical protein [Mucilaginibacter sp.]